MKTPEFGIVFRLDYNGELTEIARSAQQCVDAQRIAGVLGHSFNKYEVADTGRSYVYWAPVTDGEHVLHVLDEARALDSAGIIVTPSLEAYDESQVRQLMARHGLDDIWR